MTEQWDNRETRSDVRRILQIMNQYGLAEFEFESENGDQSIELSRADTDNFPPLLEGRSESVPGVIRAPAVGRLQWSVDAGDEVEKGDTLGIIQHHEGETDVIADVDGIVHDPEEARHVEYGQRIASVVPAGDEALDDADNSDEIEGEDDGDES